MSFIINKTGHHTATKIEGPEEINVTFYLINLCVYIDHILFFMFYRFSIYHIYYLLIKLHFLITFCMELECEFYFNYFFNLWLARHSCLILKKHYVFSYISSLSMKMLIITYLTKSLLEFLLMWTNIN